MRRRVHAIVMLALLLAAPAPGRAQVPPDAAVPVAPTASCVVAAEDGWTEQEKLVWRRVCAGEVADFEAEPWT